MKQQRENYRKDLVYLNDYTMYVVEDVSGADVDKYHYEINFLPKWGSQDNSQTVGGDPNNLPAAGLSCT